MREQRIALEHHIDRTPMRRHRREIDAVEQDAAGARPLEAGDQSQQRGLAAAGGSEQRKKLARDRCRATAGRRRRSSPKRLLRPSMRNSGCKVRSAQGAKPRFAKPRCDPTVCIDAPARDSARCDGAPSGGTLEHFATDWKDVGVNSRSQRRRSRRAFRHRRPPPPACAAPDRNNRPVAPPAAAAS